VWFAGSSSPPNPPMPRSLARTPPVARGGGAGTAGQAGAQITSAQAQWVWFISTCAGWLYNGDMARHIHLQAHLSSAELAQRYRAAKEPHERSWWQILWLLSRGHSATTIAESTGYSRYWIGQLAKRYNEEGPGGMTNRQHTTSRRQAALLSPAVQGELQQALAGPAPEDDVWTGRTVAEWMAQRLGRPVSTYRGWVYLRRLQPRPRHGTPRRRHVLADPAAQETFKKTSVPC
jgi:hypothetical protein